jgi:hypothetical protein
MQQAQHFSRPRVDLAFSRAYQTRRFGNSVEATNMSRAMKRGYEFLASLPNGKRPIDGARPAHGSDLA